jgi:hypothetical protein
VAKAKPLKNGSTRPAETTNGLAPSTSINLDDFRVSQDFAVQLQARKTVITVPVQRPDRQQWIWIHPEPDWRLPVYVLEDKENRRTFIALKDIAPEVMGDLVHKLLVAYCTKQGTPGLWPIKLPDETGRLDSYNESALAIVTEYAGQWVRIICNQQSRAYEVLSSPQADAPAPQWPSGAFPFLLETAFRGRIIRNIDHPELKALRGEA